MSTTIKKPTSASRLYRAKRNLSWLRRETPSNLVREPYVNTRHKAEPGKHNIPKPVEKPASLSITDYQRTMHEQSAVNAHAFHADRSVYGTFGQSPQNRNPKTVVQRKREAATS